MFSETLNHPGKHPVSGASCTATLAVCVQGPEADPTPTLRAIEFFRSQQTIEVLVVLGSEAGDLPESQPVGGKILRAPGSAFPEMRNTALAHATGRHIAFLDAGAIPESDWLALLSARMAADPGLWAATGFTRGANGIDFCEKIVFCDDAGTEYRCDNVDFAVFPSRRTPLYLRPSVHNALFRTERLRYLGGYDQALSTDLAQTDLARRMHDAGATIDAVPGAEVHLPRGARRAPQADRMAELAALAVDHAGATECRTAVPWPDATMRPPARRRLASKEDPLRLCLVARDHSQARSSGIETWSRVVAGGLAERGHEVTLLGLWNKQTKREHCTFTSAGYWAHGARHFGQARHIERDCFGLPEGLANISKSLLGEAERISARRRFQILGAPVGAAQAASALIASAKVPTVLSLHTCTAIARPHERLKDGPHHTDHLLRCINAEVRALRESAMLLANSNAILKDLSEATGLDLSVRPHAVIPHGMEDIADPVGHSEKWLEARSRAGGPVRILQLGRLEPRKGVAHGVQVLGQLLQGSDNVRVEIVGEGKDPHLTGLVREFAAAFSERVVWHGFLDSDALDRLMRRTDVLFAPALYESFGLSHVEAKRYAIPSVAYETGGVPEVVHNGHDGLLAPLGDRRTLLANLEELVRNAGLRTRMGLAARRSFETEFYYSLMIDRLVDLYRETLARWQACRG